MADLNLKEKLTSFWQKLSASVAEKTRVEVTMVTGDVNAFLTEGKFDWNKFFAVKLEAVAGAKVKLLMASSTDMIDGDFTLFVAPDPELQPLIQSHLETFKAAEAAGLQTWRDKAKFVSDLLQLVKVSV